MPYLLQMYFTKAKVTDSQKVYEETVARAHSINDEPGFIYKLWTQDNENNLAGGVYLFETKEEAIAYDKMHIERLKKLGHSGFVSNIFEINEEMTAINHGPLLPKNK